MFQNDENNRKPISIIITTIAAELYNNEDNIFDTLCSFLLGAEKYITSHMNHGEYYIKNPSYTGGTILEEKICWPAILETIIFLLMLRAV